jgi:hypothetical protein
MAPCVKEGGSEGHARVSSIFVALQRFSRLGHIHYASKANALHELTIARIECKAFASEVHFLLWEKREPSEA